MNRVYLVIVCAGLNSALLIAYLTQGNVAGVFVNAVAVAVDFFILRLMIGEA